MKKRLIFIIISATVLVAAAVVVTILLIQQNAPSNIPPQDPETPPDDPTTPPKDPETPPEDPPDPTPLNININGMYLSDKSTALVPEPTVVLYTYEGYIMGEQGLFLAVDVDDGVVWRDTPVEWDLTVADQSTIQYNDMYLNVDTNDNLIVSENPVKFALQTIEDVFNLQHNTIISISSTDYEGKVGDTVAFAGFLALSEFGVPYRLEYITPSSLPLTTSTFFVLRSMENNLLLTHGDEAFLTFTNAPNDNNTFRLSGRGQLFLVRPQRGLDVLTCRPITPEQTLVFMGESTNLTQGPLGPDSNTWILSPYVEPTQGLTIGWQGEYLSAQTNGRDTLQFASFPTTFTYNLRTKTLQAPNGRFLTVQDSVYLWLVPARPSDQWELLEDTIQHIPSQMYLGALGSRLDAGLTQYPRDTLTITIQ